MKYSAEQRAAMHAALDKMIDKDESGRLDKMPPADDIRALPSEVLMLIATKANTSTLLGGHDQAAERLETVSFNNLVLCQVLRGEL